MCRWRNTQFQNLPPHVQRAYQHKNSVTQIPILIHLLQLLLRYSRTEVLYRELSEGFPLIGKLTRGVNWRIRQDREYREPTPIEEFRSKNREYTFVILEKNTVDDHGEFMLNDILGEVKLGCMNGPFADPDWWPKQSVAPSKCEHKRVIPLPHDDPFIAMAFSVEQTGSGGRTKLRRGEDWRRSGHNSTCVKCDQPFHRTGPLRLPQIGFPRPRWSLPTTPPTRSTTSRCTPAYSGRTHIVRLAIRLSGERLVLQRFGDVLVARNRRHWP